jgi:hypothetical protein
MTSAVPIRNIDIIVYPFFGLGYELKTANGQRKCSQWIKNMEQGLKTRDTAFVVLHMAEHEMEEYEREAVPFIKKFNSVFKKLRETHLGYSDWAGSSLQQGMEIESWLSGKLLAEKIKIRYYGQHAGACVTTIGEPLSHIISIRLKAKRKVEATFKEARALSVKDLSSYASRILGHSVSKVDAIRFLEAVAAKEKGASIMALRHPRKVNAFLRKRAK